MFSVTSSMRLVIGLQRHPLGDLLDPDPGDLNLHAVDHGRRRGGNHGVALLQRHARRVQQTATFGRRQTDGADRAAVVDLHGSWR